jgi:hypothetical protein
VTNQNDAQIIAASAAGDDTALLIDGLGYYAVDLHIV